MEDFVRQTEFVAHATAVTCLSIGPKSTQVYATGGEDAKVNIFRIGSTENIWTLGQNKSAIRCLCFDSDENYVVSGAQSGALRVFDLNVGKLARSLGSHQVAATSIQYHPYGEFLVSGSEDCTMKFWDVRNKTCVETYTGHKKEITCVRFSPDGKWVASAGKDGNIHFYDLIASKHIDTIKIAPTYVTSFEFNPTELTLAATTSGRNLRIYDLDTMKQTFNTPPEAFALKTFTFSNLGTSLYSPGKNSLKIWDLEGVDGSGPRLQEIIEGIYWGESSIADMKVANNDQLVGASFVSNFVTTWEIDLGLYASQKQESKEDYSDRRGGPAGPSYNISPSKGPIGGRSAPSGAADVKTSAADYKQDYGYGYKQESPPVSSSASVPNSSVAPSKGFPQQPQAQRGAALKAIEEDDRDDYYNDFHDDSGFGDEDDDFGGDDKQGPTSPSVVKNEASNLSNSQNMAASLGETFFKKFQAKELGIEDDDQVLGGGGLGEDDDSLEAEEKDEKDMIPLDELQDLLPGPSYGRDRESVPQAQAAAVNRAAGVRQAPAPAPAVAVPRTAVAAANRGLASPPPKTAGAAAGPSMAGKVRAAGISSNPNDPLEVVGMRHMNIQDTPSSSAAPPSRAGGRGNVSDYPQARPASGGNMGGQNDVQRCHDIMDKLLSSSSTLTSTLSNRMANLKVLKRLWHAGEILDVIDHLTSLADAMKMSNPQNIMILTDFFQGIELKGYGFNLDMCVKLLPILDELLAQANNKALVSMVAAVAPSSSPSSSGSTGNEMIVLACYRMFIDLTSAFGELIRSTRAVHSIGVDISREARLNKCNACYDVFYRAKQRVETLRHQFKSHKAIIELLDSYMRLANTFYL